MSKHTPGPWKNHGRQQNTPGLPHSAVAAKTLLARVYSEAYGDVEQETANARLIAAAPELLDALQRIAEYPVTRADELTIEGAREIARAALARGVA